MNHHSPSYASNHPFSDNYINQTGHDRRTIAQGHIRQTVIQPLPRAQESIAVHDDNKLAKLKRGRSI